MANETEMTPLMKLWDLLTGGSETPPVLPFDQALTEIFTLLCHGNRAVANEIADCLRDTQAYCQTHNALFDRRGLRYNPSAEPWLQWIAAADAALSAGYLTELAADSGEAAFRAAVSRVLQTNHISFSLERITFDSRQKIPGWAAHFNEYAGQSGITLYAIDTDSDSYVMGAAELADYAAAADMAERVGIPLSVFRDSAHNG